MHPHAKDARRTGREKMKSMGRTGNLDISKMNSVGENMAGGIRESSASMQHRHKSGASGMKRGGRFGKHRSKTKPDMAALMAAAPPDAAAAPPPGAGAAPPMPPQGPVPPPMQKHGGRTKYQAGGAADDDEQGPVTPLPPSPFEEIKGSRKRIKVPKGPTTPPPVEFKRGGRHGDAKEDRKIVKGMVKGSALKKYARGGGVSTIPEKLPMAGHNIHGGGETGEGRLEKAHTSRR